MEVTFYALIKCLSIEFFPCVCEKDESAVKQVLTKSNKRANLLESNKILYKIEYTQIFNDASKKFYVHFTDVTNKIRTQIKII